MATTITSGATVAARHNISSGGITTLAAIAASCAVVATVWVMLAPVRRMESAARQAARQAEAAATVANLADWLVRSPRRAIDEAWGLGVRPDPNDPVSVDPEVLDAGIRIERRLTGDS